MKEKLQVLYIVNIYIVIASDFWGSVVIWANQKIAEFIPS